MSDLITRIEAIIKSKGITFNRVEHDCGLGNGTIKRWGEQSPRLDKLVVVSKYLDVSLDYLVFGSLKLESSQIGEMPLDLSNVKKEQGLVCDGSPLEKEEADLIAMLRLMSDQQQEEVFDFTYFKYRRYVERKRESIYSTYGKGNTYGKSGPDEDENAPSGTA